MTTSCKAYVAYVEVQVVKCVVVVPKPGEDASHLALIKASEEMGSRATCKLIEIKEVK